jgi:DNA-binding SARP family transcriptional activator/predicted ATPase
MLFFAHLIRAAFGNHLPAAVVAPELVIRLFGGLSLTRNGAPLGPFVSSKAPALLAYLAVTRRAHTRDALAALFWGELPDADARNNLRQALSNLRKLAEPHLTITRETVEFNRAAPYTLDVEAFERAVRANTVEALQEAAAQYTGDFLAGVFVRDAPEFEEWMLAQRARLRELALHALHTLTHQLSARGRYSQAIDAATQLLALDPWREEAHRQLMVLQARTGQRSAALAQYETCRKILEKELGVMPSAETQALYQRIRAAGELLRPTLPAPATPLIGREAELEAIVARLRDPYCRLLTCTGLGGSGKTRLALAAAAQLQPAFLHGACFVSLTNVTAPEQLPLAVAGALRLPVLGEDSAAQLLAYLAEKELLLVLDNFEQLTGDEASAGLLVSLLEQAPEVKLLITSRERLNLHSEWLFDIKPLNGDDAVAVFRHYAGRAAAPAAVLSDEALPAIRRVCDLAGRLPLALALAASWTRTLSYAEIVAALQSDMALLSTATRDAPERHRSMQAVFDHSWRLLAPTEQPALAALAVFCNPFTADAAQTVAGATPAILTALVDKSWLQRADDQRFELHELVRHYARGKLAQPEEALARHCAYFAAAQAAREPLVRTARQMEAFSAMRHEADDIRLMWQTAVQGRRADVLDKTLHSLFWMIDVTGQHVEGMRLFAEAVRCLGDEPGSESIRARLLARQGALARLVSDYAQAETLLTQAEALSWAAGDVANQAYALRLLGFFPIVRGEAEAGRARLAESVRLYRTLTDLPRLADALLSLGIAESRLGHFEQAAQLHQEAADILSEVGDEMGLAVAHDNLGDAAYYAGDPARALAHYRTAADIQRRFDDRRDLAVSLNNIAKVLNELEQWAKALPAAQESSDLFRERGSRDGLMNALQAQAGALLGLGEVAQASECFSEAVAIGRQLNADADLLTLLAFGAKLLRARGQVENAARLLLSIKRHPAASAFTAQTAGAALDELPAETIAKVTVTGKVWTLAEALEVLRSLTVRT